MRLASSALVLRAMKLLLDIGNSRLKCAYAIREQLFPLFAVLQNEPDFIEQLTRQWQALPDVPNELAISCVGRPENIQRVLNLAEQLWPGIRIKIPKAQAFALGVHNAYQEPQKLGIDRWLALIAVRQICREDVCVIDCGTAITLDFMSAHGQHLGGLISPGLTLMKQSLAKGTEQLMFTETDYLPGLANHTEAAIYSGTLFAAAGLIEKVLKSQPTTCKLFLTGGDAPLLATQLNRMVCIVPELVLQGLLAVSDEDNG